MDVEYSFIESARSPTIQSEILKLFHFYTNSLLATTGIVSFCRLYKSPQQVAHLQNDGIDIFDFSP